MIVLVFLQIFTKRGQFMKKLTYLFMAFLLVFLAACSSNETTSKEENAETKKEEKKKEQGVAEAKAKAEAEAKAKEEAEAKAQAEAEAKAKAEAKAQAEAEAKAKAEAEAKAQAEISASSTTSSGGSEFFANCTDLRKVYPNGVPADHPAYQSKMDRDKDNYACEN